MESIVIIGTGMAGYTLAREFRKLNSETPLVLITHDDGANYAKPNLSNAFGTNKAAHQIALADVAKMAQQLGATIYSHCSVTEIDPAGKALTLCDAQGTLQTLSFAKLVLAVGAHPIRLPIEGSGAKDVVVVNSLQDYHVFREQLTQRPNSNVVIIGAGLIGCEFANDMIHAGFTINVIDLAATPLGRLLPEALAHEFQDKLTAAGIRFELGTQVTRIDKQDNRYTVSLSNGHVLNADVVLSAVGLKPNLDLAQKITVHTNRGIVVSRLLETSIPHIYAIGDCAEVDGYVLPYVMPIMQQTRALAHTLNGTPTRVHYPVMPVAVKTPLAPLVIAPPPLNLAVEWISETFEDGMQMLARHDGQLVGFALLGSQAGKTRLSLVAQMQPLLAE